MQPLITYMTAPHVPQDTTPRHVIDNISDTARQFTVFKRPYFDEFRQREVHEVTFNLPGKFQLGAVEERGRLILLHVGAHGEENQRNGYGTAAAEAAIKYAADNGLRFFANEYLIPPTEHLVAAVRRKGHVTHVIEGGSWVQHGVPSVEVWTGPASFKPLHDSPLKIYDEWDVAKLTERPSEQRQGVTGESEHPQAGAPASGMNATPRTP